MKKSTGIRQLWVFGLLIGVLDLIFSLTVLGDACGRPYRMGRIPASTLGCGACHVNPDGGGARNSFGQDYQVIGIVAGDRYTDDLRARDSDGDGYSNDQEFAAGTHPGDAASRPRN